MKEKLSPKVEALYEAVGKLIEEGTDINNIKVSDITGLAGIGKGTAYEYFKNKEEIISSAILYQISSSCAQMDNEFVRLNGFINIIHYIFNCMEEEIKKRECFIKYIHILSDNGAISRTLHKKLEERSESLMMPEDLIDKMIGIGVDKGEIQEHLPGSYMRMAVAAKLIVYAMYLTGEKANGGCGKQQMRQLICDSLLKEFQ